MRKNIIKAKVQSFHEYQAEIKQERKKDKGLRQLKKNRKGMWQS